jgi:hypothetical protein
MSPPTQKNCCGNCAWGRLVYLAQGDTNAVRDLNIKVGM